MSFRAAFAALAAWGALAVGSSLALVHVLDRDRAYLPRRYAPEGAVQVVGLGASHTRAFHYPSLGANGYSLQEDGSDLETAEYRLRMVLGEEPGVKLVLVAMSPGLFAYDFELAAATPGARRRWTVNAPFAPREMSAREIRDRLFAEIGVLGNGSSLAIAQLGALGEIVAGWRAEPARCATGLPMDQRANRYGIPGGYPQRAAPADCLSRMRGAEIHAARYRASLDADPRLPAKNAARLERMIALAEVHGARLVLVTPPYTEHYARSAALAPLAALDAGRIRALQARTGVIHLDFRDFFDPDSYATENRVFTDDNHLNRTGSIQFSLALRGALAERGLLPVSQKPSSGR